MKSRGLQGLSLALSASALLMLGVVVASDANAEGKRDTLYVGDQADNTVKTFDAVTGFSKGILIPPAGQTSPLVGPRGMVFSDDDLLVVNQNVNLTIPGEVLRFDKHTGTLLKKVVPEQLKNGKTNPDAPGAPRGMVVWNDRIVVASITDDPADASATPAQGSVREYTESGRLILPIMQAPFAPKTFHPRGVVTGPDGLLYVSNAPNLAGPNGHVVRFDPQQRKFIDTFVDNTDGTAKDCTANLNRPEGLVFGRDGRLYVTTFRADGNDPKTPDTDAILVFDGPDGAHPGACVDHIDLDAPGSVNGSRAFAQAILFGPGGFLFVPISNNGTDTGAIRRYDVANHTFTNFVAAKTSPLVSPDFLTFGKTDPETLDYPEE